MTINHVIFLLFIGLSVQTYSQQKNNNVYVSPDTLKTDSIIKLHSPKKAALYSAVLPGSGQAYNKKYWKMPIIYAGLGTAIYFGISNHKEFKTYKDAYTKRVDNDESTIDQFDGRYTDGNLRDLMSYYQRNRDLSYVLAGLVYVLNIIDASVDAHFYYFNVSNDLSMSIQPAINIVHNNKLQSGLSLTINL